MAADLISGLYLATVLFFLARLVLVGRGAARLIRRSDPLSTDARYWDRHGIRDADLRCSREIAGPVTAGWRRPALLLPAGFLEGHSESEVLAAIGHECAHIRRDDFRKNLLYEAAGLFTAFHPAAWFIRSQIAETREMICDRMAADQLPDPRVYARSLIELAKRMPPPAAVSHALGMFDRNILERRIMILTTPQPRTSRTQRIFRAAAAGILLSLSAGGVGYLTRSVTAQSSTPSGQSKTQTATPDLSCTYYEKGKGSEGTCGVDPDDQTRYRCFSKEDHTRSQSQIGCEWKVKRAEEARKK